MKKLLVMMMLLLNVIGVGKLWAETITFDYEEANGNLFGRNTTRVIDGTRDITSSVVTMTLISTNSSRGVNFNSNDKQVKFEGKSGDNSGAQMRISVQAGCTITGVTVNSSENYPKNFTASTGTYTATTSSPYVGTWSGSASSILFDTESGNVDKVTSITVTYTDNRSELSAADFKFNRDDEYYSGTGGGLYVNSTAFNTDNSDPFEFVYDVTKTTIHAKLNLIAEMNATAADFSVTSSNADVLDVSSGSFRIANSTRVYLDGIQVKSAGTANLTFTYKGSNTYKPATRTVTFNVKAPNTTFAGNYKYTWTFNDGVWENSKLQTAYHSNSYASSDSKKWTINTTAEARNVGNIPANNGIEKIQGLAFTAVDGGLCLDWTNNCIWLNGSVTIPNLVKGQVITFAAVNDATITVGGTTLTGSEGTFTYTVTEDAPEGLTFAVNGKHIYSIAVSNSLYGWEYTTESATLDGTSRKIKGTFTFTEEGPIAGGTVIDEVPGITMTVGTSGTDYMVSYDSHIDYAPHCKSYVFTPTVNGYLTLQIWGVTSQCVIREGNGKGFVNPGTINPAVTYTTTLPLEAGKVYTLKDKNDAVDIYLHSFTFRPAFLNPTTNTDQLNVGNFAAHVNDPAISAFPKLIDPTSEAQQDRVKFAGDRTIVHLYKNNDVEIIGAGTDVLIRGTVLDKNNEDGLVAYYYLNSYVLNLVSSELDDQAYIATDGLTDNNYQFDFSGNIQPATGSTVTVLVKKDNGASENVTATITNNILYVPFASLEEGATYKMTIPENTLALTTDAATKNSEIIRTFSVNKAEELQVKMVYPTDIATVGTTIVLETYVDGSTSGLTLNDGAKVKAILSAEGEEDMEIDATFSGNHLAFKPTHTLNYNKDYTLTYTYNAANNVITSKPVSDKIYKVTHNKVFTFTTGSSSGTAPVVATTSPTADAVIPGSAYSGGRISFTFDQTVDLEPYSTVTVTPVNGSEATTTASTHAPGAGGNTLLVDSDGKTVYFNYNADGVKYDLYYQVVIPANTIVGVGGLPNSQPITLNFRMGKNPNATEVDPDTFYPHTWDFNKLGDKTDATTTAYNIVNNYGDPGSADKRINSLIQSSKDGYTCYTTKGQEGYGFDQGNDVYFNDKTGVKHVLQEFEGIRINLVNTRSDRFELRNLSSKSGEGTNADGTDKWQFRMNGNTHYMTLSNVPVGKLYMVVNSPYLGINSPNATFEEVEGATISNEGTLMNTNGATKKIVINVTEAGDLVFCLKVFSCEKIAVAANTKTFKKNYVKDGKTYATDCLGYDVRYDLLNAFTDHSVKAYYITDMANSTGNTATVTATEVNQVNAVKGSQGVLVVYQGAVENNTEVPVFKADVNTSAKEVVASGATSEQLVNLFKTKDEIASKPADHYLYVLSYTGSQGGDLGFYNYVGSAYVDRAAYLFMPKEWVGEDPYGSGTTSARKASLMLINAEGVTTGLSEVETEKTPNNDGYYYNLNGMRVEHPKAGIYIRNGKKVVMK